VLREYYTTTRASASRFLRGQNAEEAPKGSVERDARVKPAPRLLLGGKDVLADGLAQSDGDRKAR
jgi:hypothetical protein